MTAIGVADLPNEVVIPLVHLLASNGKQLRSQILIACAQAGRRVDDPEVRSAAVAIELFQLATLAHDDVVDAGEMRRGAQTVALSYGNAASGFVGGVLFARALELIAALGAEPLTRFATTASRVCLGQMQEGEDLFDLARSMDRYYTVIDGKTASLFELAAWLGAWLARADEETASTYARFGREFGTAFQIADDVLDLVASESETGKSPAKDLRQGVYTLPVLYALARDPELRGALDAESLQKDVGAVITRVKLSGGIEHAIGDCQCLADGAAALLREGIALRPSCVESPISLLYKAVQPVTRLREEQASAA